MILTLGKALIIGIAIGIIFVIGMELYHEIIK